MKVERITKKQALRAVRAKLPLRSDKAIEENLSWMTSSLAEAYRVGAEEAQIHIAARIQAIGVKRAKPAPAAPTTWTCVICTEVHPIDHASMFLGKCGCQACCGCEVASRNGHTCP